ncbi:MAG: c-type cytochrome [Chitinophagales bacterium]
MKKFLRWLLIIVIIIIVLIGGFAAFIAIRGIPHYKAEQISLKVESTPQRVARGQVLVSLLCRTCHFDPNTHKLTGRKLDEVPQFGEVYSKNITQDPVYGIGKWTDGEIAYLLRTGVRPDGRYIPPYMAKLPHLSDEDLFSVISFLHSDHPWFAPDNTTHPDTKPSFLTKFLCNMGITKPFPYPKGAIPQPDTNNAVQWGQYLVYNLECFSCHSADFKKNNYLDPEKSKGYCGGGNVFKMQDGNEITSLNITSDEQTGIGKWDTANFVTAVKSGILPNNQPSLRPPMQPYAALSDNEVKAIYAYLKTIPKISNKVDRKISD